ncbi:hypothetical protein GYA28_01815 [Candidatus Roizmanbacteria bacterium]|jgi:hypothetical protein|nr:hypothetical protein [Candidatus Roizmanbacteria bacterium]
MEQNPQVVLSWKAPLRPYKKRGKLVMRFFIAVALLLSLIVFFFGDKILLIPIWSLLFLFYALTITPPPEVENKITKFGIETAGITLRWEALSHFYFKERFGFQILTVVSLPPYFYHAYLVVDNKETKNKLVSLLAEHLIYQEKPQRSFTDKAVDWLSNLIPDEEEISSPKVAPAVSSK